MIRAEAADGTRTRIRQAFRPAAPLFGQTAARQKPDLGTTAAGRPVASSRRYPVGAVTNDHPPSPPRPRCRSLMGVRVVGTGSYAPDGVVTNDHLHARLGFDSDWIIKRTGILERRHVLPHQATSDLCVEAAKRCIEQAKV